MLTTRRVELSPTRSGRGIAAASKLVSAPLAGYRAVVALFRRHTYRTGRLGKDCMYSIETLYWLPQAVTKQRST